MNSIIQAAHTKALEMETVKYPITQGECKTCTVSSGTRNHAEENLYSDQIPKRILIGFVKNSCLNGTYQTNQFQFEHFDMDPVALWVRVWVAHPFLVRQLSAPRLMTGAPKAGVPDINHTLNLHLAESKYGFEVLNITQCLLFVLNSIFFL